MLSLNGSAASVVGSSRPLEAAGKWIRQRTSFETTFTFEASSLALDDRRVANFVESLFRRLCCYLSFTARRNEGWNHDRPEV
ncbi:MAG: hypothetical protein ACTS6G_05265 [Candidatus Hodgkinia cicadicola]